MDQAIQAARGEAQGYKSCPRIAICDSLAQSRIATLLARSREEEPELEIRVFDSRFLSSSKACIMTCWMVIRQCSRHTCFAAVANHPSP